MPREHGILSLSDGRTLAYAEYGDPSGPPVLFFHPTPGSRLDAAQTKPSPFRLIAPDRPGYGKSDPLQERTLEQFARDVGELADALRIPSFAVAGVSGGGPHALACAAFLTQRVNRAAVMCGVGPLFEMHELGLLPDASAPPTDEELAAHAATMHQNAEAIAQVGISQSPAGDQALFTPDRIALWVRSTVEGTVRPDGMVEDYHAFTRPWGFALSRVTVPVGLWYGDADPVVSLAQGRYLQEHLPKAQLHVLPGIGHLGTPLAALAAVTQFLGRRD
ncbi:MAG: alpha/beta hydrolase [Thermaerobacter sp.]|nr:alpha/beta hydrolase [Thermaerobacter sp.]